MRHYYYLLIMAIVTLFSAYGCGDSEGDNLDEAAVVPTTPTLTTDARPTDWTPVTTDIDPQSSMSVDVVIDLSKLSLTYAPNAQDLVAAFVAGSCRAVASPNFENIQRADSTDCVFLLTVRKLTTDSPYAPVTLKYYSARLQHIFTAPTFQYVDEGIKGSISDPFKPEWQK